MEGAFSESDNSENVIPSSNFEPPPPVNYVLTKARKSRISTDEPSNKKSGVSGEFICVCSSEADFKCLFLFTGYSVSIGFAGICTTRWYFRPLMIFLDFGDIRHRSSNSAAGKLCPDSLVFVDNSSMGSLSCEISFPTPKSPFRGDVG